MYDAHPTKSYEEVLKICLNISGLYKMYNYSLYFFIRSCTKTIIVFLII